MAQFVNYKKRGITLPPGCKDLIDVMAPSRRRTKAHVGASGFPPFEIKEDRFSTAGLEYSYGQRCTSGIAPGQFPCGGGEEVVHSSPFAFQGLSGAFRPANALQKKFTKNRIWEMPRTIALTVRNWFRGWRFFRNGYWYGS